MSVLSITGSVRDRFIQAAVLLRMLDPVRGDGSAYSLDQNMDDVDSHQVHLWKRKFLDSFALVCATRRDGDTVSAACLEEGRPEGTVIRISSNAGISPTTLSRLRELVAMLNHIASRAPSPFCTESDVLLSIIRLDLCKIRKYLKKLRIHKKAFEASMLALEESPRNGSAATGFQGFGEFLIWKQEISSIFEICDNPEPETLLDHIQRAQITRRYLDFIKAANPIQGQPLPWVILLFKVGRYGIASRAFVKLAIELPALFSPMIVEPVTPTPKTSYTIPRNTSPLTAVLRRIVASDQADEYVRRLSAIWNVADPEADFRSTCSMSLVVHAELQLVNFYDHNRQCKPYFGFIGKLYLPWIPPPSPDSRIYKQYKTLTSNMSKILEAAIRQHLESRLYIARRPVPLDSTAGVSLTGLITPVHPRTVTPPCSDRGVLSRNGDEAIAGERVTETVAMVLGPFSHREVERAQSPFHDGLQDNRSSFGKMVFHVKRMGSSNQQDIISMIDIFDCHTGLPSWRKLVNILQITHGFGLAFKEDLDYMLVHDSLRVSGERQLRASIQYLLNMDILNVKVLICTYEQGAERQRDPITSTATTGREASASPPQTDPS